MRKLLDSPWQTLSIPSALFGKLWAFVKNSSQGRQILMYDVATISRLPKNIGLFCKRAL